MSTVLYQPRTDSQETSKADGVPSIPETGKLYGYIRVSTKDRNEEDQMVALRKAGVHEEDIFIDVITGADRAALEFGALLRQLQQGDTLIITGFDKIGSTYDDVINHWQVLTKMKGVDVVVLDIPLLDTRLRQQELQDSFIADLALQFLAYIAMRERELIRQRQREGILAAKERGVRFGRPPKPIPPQFEALLSQWKNKEISSRKAAQQLGVAQETFLRWSRKKE